MLEEIILGLLTDRDMTGYDIRGEIEHKLGIFYKPSFGCLYPALKRLAAKGLAECYEKDGDSRNKNYYRITEAGKEAFFSWLVSPVDIYDGANAALTKVYFFDKLPDDVAKRRLLEYEMNNMNYLDKLKTLEKKLTSAKPENCYYRLSTLYYGICITEKTIEWCRCIRDGKPLHRLYK